MKLARVEEMQRLDEAAIRHGIPAQVLMENAGRGAAERILERFPIRGGRPVAVVAGKGNNGGDGMVVARTLRQRGIAAEVWLLGTRHEVRGEAKINLDLLEGAQVAVHEVLGEGELGRMREQLLQASLIVDAIFGTGLKQEVSGLYRQAIEAINAAGTAGRPVVALDLPSGLEGNRGRILGNAVRATLTVTFGLPKIGLVLDPGAACAGILEVVDIGIPPALVEEQGLKHALLEPAALRALIPARPPEAHKGDYGHLLVLAGSVGKTGAAAMAAQAALRVGTGLVTVGVPESLNPILEVKLTEAMTEPLPETDGQSLAVEAWNVAARLCAGKSALALGPGLGQHPETAAFVHRAIREAPVPLVVDADGVNALARHLGVLKEARVPVVLTPHPGEMGRLLGARSEEIQADRVRVAREFAVDQQVYLVLKGARTLVADPAGEVFVNPTGNPGMASGGMGDVLTGMIGGFLAQGLLPLEAAKLGVYLHGWAADRVAARRGMAGLLATDVIDELPAALRDLGAGER